MHITHLPGQGLCTSKSGQATLLWNKSDDWDFLGLD
jgi:hypothetical protein